MSGKIMSAQIIVWGISLLAVAMLLVPGMASAKFVTDGTGATYVGSYSDTSYGSYNSQNFMVTHIDIESMTSGGSKHMLYSVKQILYPYTGGGYYIQVSSNGYAAALRFHDPTSAGNAVSFIAATPTSNLDYRTSTIVNMRLGLKYDSAIHSTSTLSSDYTKWNFDMSKRTASTYYSQSTYREVDFRLYATTGYYDSASVASSGVVVDRPYSGTQSISVMSYGWLQGPQTELIAIDWTINYTNN